MRTIILPLLFFAALVTYFLFNEIRPIRQHLAEQKTAQSLYILPESASIVRLKIIHHSASYEVEGKDEVWRIIDPVLEMGNSLLLSGMEKVLRLYSRDSTLENPSKNLADYGLEKPFLRIGVMQSTASQYRYLAFGTKAPIGDVYYARWEDEQHIFLVSKKVVDIFNKDLFAVRDRMIFSLSVYDRVTEIEYTLNAQHARFCYTAEKDLWMIEEPIRDYVHARMIQELTDAMQKIVIEEFRDAELISDPALQLIDKKMFVRVVTEKKNEIILWIGAESADGKYYSATVAGRTIPIYIAKEKLEPLQRDPSEFIDRRIIRQEPSAFERICYTKGTRQEILERQEFGWLLNGSQVQDGNRARAVTDMLEFLTAITSAGILPPEAVIQKAFKPDDIICSVTISVAAGSSTARSDITIDFIAQKNGYFVHTAPENIYYEITEADYTQALYRFVKSYD